MCKGCQKFWIVLRPLALWKSVDFDMFWRVFCLWMREGSYILRAIKSFRIFEIGNVQREMLEGSFDWRRIAGAQNVFFGAISC